MAGDGPDGWPVAAEIPPEDEHAELLGFALAPAVHVGVRLWAAIYYKETVSGDGV